MRFLALAALSLIPVSVAAAHSGSVSPTAMGRPQLAAAQVALGERALYSGPVDGIRGTATATALRTFQAQVALPASGRLTVSTLHALDQAPIPGPLTVGSQGLRVAELQFRLAWHGFPSGPPTTMLTKRVETALRKFQLWVGLAADGIAGQRTLAALAAPPAQVSLPLSWPLDAPVADRFGPRRGGFHTGIDIPAPTGTAVSAAAAGVVIQAGSLAGGYGLAVTIDHGGGVATLYAHLSRVLVTVGASLTSGTAIGAVGATGDATGPHLHFEVQLRGAATDPLRSLPAAA